MGRLPQLIQKYLDANQENFIGPNEAFVIDFSFSRAALMAMPSSAPLVLFPAIPNAFIEIHSATLNVLDGAGSDYDGGSLRIGYRSDSALLDIVRDMKRVTVDATDDVLQVSNETVQHFLEFRLGNSGTPPVTGSTYRGKPETYSGFYSGQTIKGKNVVIWNTLAPGASGTSAKCCIRFKVTYGIPKISPIGVGP